MDDATTASDTTEELNDGEHWDGDSSSNDDVTDASSSASPGGSTTTAEDSSSDDEDDDGSVDDDEDMPSSEEMITWLRQEAKVAETPMLRELATLLAEIKTIIDSDMAHLDEIEDRMRDQRLNVGGAPAVAAAPPARPTSHNNNTNVGEPQAAPTPVEPPLRRLLRLTHPMWCRVAKLMQTELRRGVEEVMAAHDSMPIATKNMNRAYRMMTHTNVAAWVQDVVDISTGVDAHEQVVLYVGYLLVESCGPTIVEESDEAPELIPFLKDDVAPARRLPATSLLQCLVASDDGVLSQILSSETHYTLFDRLHVNVFGCTAAERAARRGRPPASSPTARHAGEPLHAAPRHALVAPSPPLSDRFAFAHSAASPRAGPPIDTTPRRRRSTPARVGLPVVRGPQWTHDMQDRDVVGENRAKEMHWPPYDGDTPGPAWTRDWSTQPSVGVVVALIRRRASIAKAHRSEASPRMPVRLSDEFDRSAPTNAAQPRQRKRPPPPSPLFTADDVDDEVDVVVTWPERHDYRTFVYRFDADVVAAVDFEMSQRLDVTVDVDWKLAETQALLGAVAQICTTRDAIQGALQLGVHIAATAVLGMAAHYPMLALKAVGVIEALSRHSRCVLPLHDRDATGRLLRAAQTAGKLTTTLDSSPRRKLGGTSFVAGETVDNASLVTAVASCVASLVGNPAGVIAFSEHPSPRRHTMEIVQWLTSHVDDAPSVQTAVANFFAGSLHIPAVLDAFEAANGSNNTLIAKLAAMLKPPPDDTAVLEEPILGRVLAAGCALVTYFKVHLFRVAAGICCCSPGLKAFMTRSHHSVWPQGTRTMADLLSALSRPPADLAADLRAHLEAGEAMSDYCRRGAVVALRFLERHQELEGAIGADILSIMAKVEHGAPVSSRFILDDDHNLVACVLSSLRKCRSELRRERQAVLLTLLRLLLVFPENRVPLLSVRTPTTFVTTSVIFETAEALKDTDATLNVRALDCLSVALWPAAARDDDGANSEGSPPQLALAMLRSCDGLNTVVGHLGRPQKSLEEGAEPARIRGLLRVAVRSLALLVSVCVHDDALRTVLRQVGVRKAAMELMGKFEVDLARDPDLRRKLERHGKLLVHLLDENTSLPAGPLLTVPATRERSVDAASAVPSESQVALTGVELRQQPATQLQLDAHRLNVLVHAYLREQGFTSAADALKKELRVLAAPPPIIQRTLNQVLLDYVQHQHAQCSAPVAFLPPVDVSSVHRCPAHHQQFSFADRSRTSETRAWQEPAFLSVDFETTAHWSRRESHRAWRTSSAAFQCLKHRHHRHIYDARPGGEWSNPTCLSFTDHGRLLLMGTSYGDLASFEMAHDVFDEHAVESQFLYDDTFPERIQTSKCGRLIAFSLSDGCTTICNRAEMPTHFITTSARAANFNYDATRVVFTPDSSAGTEGVASCTVVDLNQPSTHIHLYDDLRRAASTFSEGADHVWTASFDATGALVLGDAALWDTRVSLSFPLARFDKFSSTFAHSTFHPAGHAVVVDAHVWDLRAMRIIGEVDAFRGASAPMFAGPVVYAWRKYDTLSVVTVNNGWDLSPISSFTLRHSVTHLAVDPDGHRIAAIADTNGGDSVVKIYRSGIESGSGPAGVLLDDGARDDDDGYSDDSSEADDASAREDEGEDESEDEEDEGLEMADSTEEDDSSESE